MADTSRSFSMVRGRVMRVTRLNACGERVLGPTSTVTSDGFITVTLSPEQEEGETISVTNAAGRVCILDEPAPAFTGYTVEVAFCGVNPDLINVMSNNPVVKDADGVGVGFRVNSDVDLAASGFALEVWSSVPSAACEGGQASYGYFLVPFVKGGLIGDVAIGNDAVNFTLTGAKTRDGSGWGVGPYDVVMGEDDTPGPLLTAIDPSDHLHLEVTQVAPPASAEGATALGVPATTATAGSPATLTPSDGYAPPSLDEADGLTASPTTAWTTGQYVLLGDGTKAHWNGTAWVAGVA